MRAIFKKSKQTYGMTRMLKTLIAMGYKIDKEKVAALLRGLGIKSRASKKFKAATTDSKHKWPVQDNKLAQDFTAPAPNLKWLGDVAFICTNEGWLYLAAIFYLCTRKIVGWAMC